MNPLARARFVLSRDQTLGTIAERLAAIHGDRRLVAEPGGHERTYHQASAQVSEWAGGIAARIQPGDRVVLATPNAYDLLLACLAASRAGGIAVPVNAHMRPDEIAHVVADSGADLIVSDTASLAGHDPLLEARPVDARDVAALFYTSGTTGRPKGAELTHRALVGSLGAGAAWPSFLRTDEAVVSLPIAHIMGFAAAVGLACAGIPVYFLAHFRPDDVLDIIEERRSSVFIGVPAMYRMMDEAGAEGRDLTCVRAWISGADAMPSELARRFKAFGATATLPVIGPVGEALFAEGYGMVELGGAVATKISPPMLDLGLGDSLGVPLPGYRFKVVDDDGAEVRAGGEGELLIHGPGVLKGYWGSPDATVDMVTADGWLRTGDLARKGAFGTALFAGRKKDVLMHGGYSVYAREVEHALEEHPDVLEAAVVGLPDERKGEVPVAAVRLAEGASLTPEALVAWAAERLAPYKAPQRVLVVGQLPRTGTNKVQKREVLALFGD